MTSYENRNLIRPIAALVGLALLVAVAVWFLARGGDSQAQQKPNQSTSSSTTTSSEQLAPKTAPANGITLPTGADQVDGHPVKFPYTDLGAAALPVEATKALVGFDYEQVNRIVTLYAAPDDLAAFKSRARDGVAMWRQETGVPTQGTVPAPASYAATPIAFTVKKLDTDYYVVNVLSYMTLTTTEGTTKDQIYAGTHLVRWIDGDWKLMFGTAAEMQQLRTDGQPHAAAPGTPEYKQAGWIPLSGAVS